MGKEPDSDLRQGCQQLVHLRVGLGEGTLLSYGPESHLEAWACGAGAGRGALRGVAEMFLFGRLASDMGTGEMAGAAAALRTGGAAF